jgi:hypothetical protein
VPLQSVEHQQYYSVGRSKPGREVNLPLDSNPLSLNLCLWERIPVQLGGEFQNNNVLVTERNAHFLTETRKPYQRLKTAPQKMEIMNSVCQPCEIPSLCREQRSRMNSPFPISGKQEPNRVELLEISEPSTTHVRDKSFQTIFERCVFFKNVGESHG